MAVNIGNNWDNLLSEDFKSQNYLELREFLKREYANFRVYPNMYDIFNALRCTAPEDVKAVIIGQDPYHGEGQAHGLCFSVKRGTQQPPSLKNIFKELHSDLGIPEPTHGELTSWANQGVLLLNTTLTVREGKPMSHRGRGWETLTDSIITKLNERAQPTAFLLWGAHAGSKAALITAPQHKIFRAAHPSPLSASRGFFGCRHFSAVNEFLRQNGIEPIDWRMPD